MKMKKTLVAGLCLMGALTNTSLLASQGRAASKTIEIAFYSPGSGIDWQSLAKVRKVLAAAVEDGSMIAYKQVHWGMEGEINLCAQVHSEDWLNKELSEIVANARHVSLSNPASFESCGDTGTIRAM